MLICPIKWEREFPKPKSLLLLQVKWPGNKERGQAVSWLPVRFIFPSKWKTETEKQSILGIVLHSSPLRPRGQLSCSHDTSLCQLKQKLFHPVLDEFSTLWKRLKTRQTVLEPKKNEQKTTIQSTKPIIDMLRK